MTRCRPREWHKRQERPALVAPHSSNVCARNLRLGLRLRHCSRAARRRRSISRASKASAHCAYAAGTWQSMAAHRLWWLVCHRQCCQSLTCVLEPQQAAAAAAVAACCCLIQSSQRRSEACRNRVVLSLLRLSAFKPIDRSWMVARVSLRRVQLATCDDVGRARARVLWSKQREKGGSDDCHKTSDLAHPGLDLVSVGSQAFEPPTLTHALGTSHSVLSFIRL